MDDTAKEPTPIQAMERFAQVLQENKGRTEVKLDTLERKLDQLARDLISAETEIRKELQTQFITRLEYEPRHQMLQQAVDALNRTMTELVAVRDRVLVLEQISAITKTRIETFDKALEDVETRARGTMTRAIPWIAVGISFIGLATQLLQHVQIR